MGMGSARPRPVAQPDSPNEPLSGGPLTSRLGSATRPRQSTGNGKIHINGNSTVIQSRQEPGRWVWLLVFRIGIRIEIRIEIRTDQTGVKRFRYRELASTRSGCLIQ